MEKTVQTTKSDEMSLKDLIISIGDWWRYLLSKWLLIAICCLIGAGLGLIVSLTSRPEHVGELTFVLEDSKASPLAAYAGLASQFGIDLGGNSGSGIFEGDNIIEFLKSRLMIETTLLTPVEVEGVKKSLADLYIESYHLDKKWEDKPRLKGLHYPLGLKRSAFTLQQDSILNIIQNRVKDKNLEVEKPDKKLSFISVTCTSLNEKFSKAFVERLVKEAIEFYVNTKLQRTKTNVDKLQLSADSLEELLNRKTYQLAATADVNQNPARQLAGVGMAVQSRDKMVLQTMYSEVIKNLEISKMAMAQETPIVQIVDTPILPLKIERIGKMIAMVVGIVVMGFCSVSFLTVKRILRGITGS